MEYQDALIEYQDALTEYQEASMEYQEALIEYQEAFCDPFKMILLSFGLRVAWKMCKNY